MKGKRLMPVIAWAIIGITIAAAYSIVLFRRIEAATDNVPVIRFAHMLVYDRAREAFDEIARRYEAVRAAEGNPVRVEQIVIPANIQSQWVRTQLLGETAPDLIQQSVMAMDSLTVARFFQPLARELDEPNPYNEGTLLEGTAWRATFHDGLEHSGFDFRLSQNFGIPFSGQTTRMVMNRELRKVIADRVGAKVGLDPASPEIPADFESLVRLFKAVECYRQETGRPVAAIAGSDQAAWNLLNRLHQSQTQRFSLENGHLGEFKANRMHYMIDVLVGRLDYPSAAERSAYRLMREVGLHLTPGALSLKRNDAFFTFSQGNALMIVVSSMDAPALRMTVGNRFELATFPIPLPTRDNPDYGAHIIGTLSESEFPPGGTFILIRQSDAVQAGRALDFLRYATSVPSARLFSETTGMPSAVVGIVPSAEVRPFTPNSAGYPPGMNLDPSAETRRVVETSLHLLLNPVGGVDPFVEALAANLRPRFRRDAADRRGQDQVLQIQDGLQAAAYFGATGQDSDADARLEELVDVNLWYEWEALAIQARLDVYDASVGD